MADSSVPKETDWITGTIDGRIVHHAPSKKLCLEWLGRKHKRLQPPNSHKVVDGVYDTVLDGTTYWLMSGAPTARANGYDIPPPEIPETYGLDRDQAALIDHPVDGPSLVWSRGGNVKRQPAPVDITNAELDEWAERSARRLKSCGISYLGRREVVL